MHMRQTWCHIGVAFLLGLIGTIDFAWAEGEPDIFYVPTPQYVVNEMLEIAGTNRDDVVYDLGCGDGRFVITAAKKYGARGVGIDIDPERIRESQAKASIAGVVDRVTFIEADLFTTNFSQASIVALYLLPQLNLRLRPQLFKELKPGTRILSHNYDMADWRPDVSERLGDSLYYLWILPADVAGLWNLKLFLSKRPDMHYTVQLTQSFQELEGEVVSEDENIEVSDLKIKGDKASFLLTRKINKLKVDMYFKGQVKGDFLSGTVQVEGGPYEGLHSWTAVRHR